MEENDYTVFTCQDLVFELELVVQGIAKKIAFIDNQVSALFPSCTLEGYSTVLLAFAQY